MEGKSGTWECDKCSWSYDANTNTTIQSSDKKKLNEAEDLLKRCLVIIDDQNKIICEHGEYASIGIVEDLMRFLNK